MAAGRGTVARRGRAGRAPLVAAVDAGTTGARAMAYGLDGRLVAEVRRPYKTSSPRPGWAEQDARDWAEGAAAALRRLAARTRAAGQIRAVGLTGQCPTMVVADAVIVGTSLKVDGATFNPVDPARAQRLMDAARAARA